MNMVGEKCQYEKQIRIVKIKITAADCRDFYFKVAPPLLMDSSELAWANLFDNVFYQACFLLADSFDLCQLLFSCSHDALHGFEMT